MNGIQRLVEYMKKSGDSVITIRYDNTFDDLTIFYEFRDQGERRALKQIVDGEEIDSCVVDKELNEMVDALIEHDEERVV